MSMGLNKVVLIGNVGRDPELRHTAEGKALATFTLATTESWRNRTTGEKKEHTEWHRIVVFSDGLVDIIKNYVKKGTKLYLEGTLKSRKWVDNNGQERYTVDIVMQNHAAVLVLLDNKKSDTANIEEHKNINNEDKSKNDSNTSNTELNDEIPF